MPEIYSHSVVDFQLPSRCPTYTQGPPRRNTHFSPRGDPPDYAPSPRGNDLRSVSSTSRPHVAAGGPPSWRSSSGCSPRGGGDGRDVRDVRDPRDSRDGRDVRDSRDREPPREGGGNWPVVRRDGEATRRPRANSPPRRGWDRGSSPPPGPFSANASWGCLGRYVLFHTFSSSIDRATRGMDVDC